MIVCTVNLDEQYDTLAAWWRKRRLTPPPKIVLAGATGITVRGGSVDIIQGWLYISASVSFLEWILGNPTVADGDTMRVAMAVLVDFFAEFAKKQGCNIMLCSTRDGGSIGRFLEHRGWSHCPGPPHQLYAKGLT